MGDGLHKNNSIGILLVGLLMGPLRTIMEQVTLHTHGALGVDGKELLLKTLVTIQEFLALKVVLIFLVIIME